MNKHIEKAMELRNETPMVNNCAQTIMRVYADELGIDENLCAAIGWNFGGGMKCGGTCGAITGRDLWCLAQRALIRLWQSSNSEKKSQRNTTA